MNFCYNLYLIFNKNNSYFKLLSLFFLNKLYKIMYYEVIKKNIIIFIETLRSNSMKI